jgi:hypothetical protein
MLKYYPLSIPILFGVGTVMFPHLYTHTFLRYRFANVCPMKSVLLLGGQRALALLSEEAKSLKELHVVNSKK